MSDVEIKISKELAEKLQKRVDENDEFKNLNEYVEYILKQVAERLENERENKEDKQEFSEEDEEKVKERLKALGYLD